MCICIASTSILGPHPPSAIRRCCSRLAPSARTRASAPGRRPPLLPRNRGSWSPEKVYARSATPCAHVPQGERGSPDLAVPMTGR
eukprot:5450425-Pyramimonas_sp.AAC.1